jgi:hypothetical protein
MTQLKRPTFRVFDTRESEEYQRILSKVLSIKRSSSTIYPDLIKSSYPLSRKAADKVTQGHGSKIKRVINIDYIGMAATVLLDREGRYTRNAHYDRLYELLSSLDKLNKRGIAVIIRLLLQYPYSLAGQNRILSEIWDNRAFMGEASGRDETKLAPVLSLQLIGNSALLRAQQDCLENFQHLRDLFETDGPNRVETRFAFVSTLICGLRVNNLFFYDPYHYGRQRGKNTCAYTSNPVVMIDGSSKDCVAYKAFCNHFRVVWECDSTLPYQDVAEKPEGTTTVIIKKPENLDTSNKINRLKKLRSKSNPLEKERAGQLHRLVNKLCPIIKRVDAPEFGFLAAAWEKKKDGSTGPCVPALILEEMFDEGFKSLGRRRKVRVTVLQSTLGSSVSRALFNLMNESTFSIILLTKEIEGKYCKPNVYIELGYLLRENKEGRAFIVVEDGTDFPADVRDITITHFRRRKSQPIDEMKRVCAELLKGMNDAGIINENTFKYLTGNWLPRWKPSARLWEMIGNSASKRTSYKRRTL